MPQPRVLSSPEIELPERNKNIQLPLTLENKNQKEIERLDSLGSLGRFKSYTLDKFVENYQKLSQGFQNLFSEEKRARGIMVTLGELNILKYLVDGVMNPLFGVITWAREEATRGSLFVGKCIGRYYDNEQSLAVSYLEFRELEQRETLLKWSKGLFDTAEILLSLAATLASGGAAAGQTAIKSKNLLSWIYKEKGNFAALFNRLKVSAVFGSVGAVSEELMEGKDLDFSASRVLGSAKTGMFYSLRFGALTSVLPRFFGKYLDKGDALGDLHEVAFADSTRILKADEHGEKPSYFTIIRRGLGFYGKAKITLADLKDNPVVEVKKILETEQQKQFLSDSVFQGQFLSKPKEITSDVAAKELYQPGFLPEVAEGRILEYRGADIEAKPVVYRFWSTESWQSLLADLSLQQSCRALTYFSPDETKPSVVNIQLDLQQDKGEILRVLFEEEYHLVRGYQADCQHEFTAKLYAEAKLKSLGYDYKSAEEILSDVLNHYQYSNADMQNALHAALTIVPDLDFSKVTFPVSKNLNIDTTSKLSYRVAASHQTYPRVEQAPFFEALKVPEGNQSYVLSFCLDALSRLGTGSIREMNTEQFVAAFSKQAGRQTIVWGKEERDSLKARYEKFWGVSYDDIEGLVAKHFSNADENLGSKFKDVQKSWIKFYQLMRL